MSKPEREQEKRPLGRDQRRALWAYGGVRDIAGRLKEAERRELRTVISGLGATILRSGLAATMAFLERERERPATRQLLELLTAWPGEVAVPGLPKGLTGAALPATVRRLTLRDYQMATREYLRCAIWLRRAVQALDVEDAHA